MVRVANEGDAAFILKLLSEVNLIHHEIRPDLFKIGTKYSEDDVKELIASSQVHIFICEEDGRQCGYLIGYEEETQETLIRTHIRTFYIDDLCVDAEVRKAGAGRQLYEYAVAYAKEHGFYNVTLHVWGGNDQAEQFYRKMGLKTQFISLEHVL